MTDQNTNPAKTPNLEQEAKALGKKIVLLLQSSDLPEDTQMAIVQTLPQMSLEEIDKLIELLTQNVMRGQQDDQVLKQKLTNIKSNYQAKQDKLADSIQADLDDLEKEIK